MCEQTLAESKVALAELIRDALEQPAAYSGKSDFVAMLWRNIESIADAELNHGYHLLIHYIDDADIRERDADYADMQANALSDIAKQLLTGGRPEAGGAYVQKE